MVAQVFRFTADIAFVSFDNAGQGQLLAALEQGTDPMAEEPRGLLPDAKMLPQLNAADALGAGENQVHREVPNVQRQVGAVHRGADGDTELLAAGPTAVKPGTTTNRTGAANDAAMCADRTIRPAHAFQMRATGFIGAETVQEGGELHGGYLTAPLKQPISNSVTCSSVSFSALVGRPRRQSVEGGGASQASSR